MKETLESVFAQSFKAFEVIVINDGSPDTVEPLLIGDFAEAVHRLSQHTPYSQLETAIASLVVARGTAGNTAGLPSPGIKVGKPVHTSLGSHEC